jgi:DNA-binding transcriptional regulator GbsR (MarR family)
VRRFIDRFGATLVESGMPRMPALVFVALLASDSGRLTAEELMGQLEVSRAAISGAVRYLGQVNMVVREREPGSRRDVYALPDGSWYGVVAGRERVLDRWIESTRAGIEILGAETAAGARMAESLVFFEFLRSETSAMLERWREQNET